jgi:hypothetical protein
MELPQINELISICENHTLPLTINAVVKEPYIPYLPEKWNRILVVAEAQNLSDTNYVNGLINAPIETRIRRLGTLAKIGM